MLVKLDQVLARGDSNSAILIKKFPGFNIAIEHGSSRVPEHLKSTVIIIDHRINIAVCRA